jgi:hypothetical protein
MCLGCARYEVTATLTGRLDTVADASIKRDASGKIVSFGGFGNMNGYPARLVLASVADVTPKEVDYSKTDAVTKGDAVLTPPPGSGGPEFDDPFAMAIKLAAHVAPGPAADQSQKAVAQFPKPKEQNGVSVVHGVGNEVTPDGPGAKDSPDGVLYNCVLNADRLQGSSMMIALFHVGQHVADLRSPKPDSGDSPLLVNENDAWVVTSIAAIVGGQKYLTLPGAYLFWNIGWPAAQRDDNMEGALKDFLSNEALLSH